MTDNDAAVTLNTEQRLYVIPCVNARGKVSGYSCLGFDVLERRGYAYAIWLRDNAPAGFDWRTPCDAWVKGSSKPETLERYAAYAGLTSAILAVHKATGQRCDAELTPQLRGLEGHRVEVVDTFAGSKPRRFIVGKSTGWIPCHLEIAKRNSSGGGAAWHEYARVRDLGQVR